MRFTRPGAKNTNGCVPYLLRNSSATRRALMGMLPGSKVGEVIVRSRLRVRTSHHSPESCGAAMRQRAWMELSVDSVVALLVSRRLWCLRLGQLFHLGHIGLYALSKRPIRNECQISTIVIGGGRVGALGSADGRQQ